MHRRAACSLLALGTLALALAHAAPDRGGPGKVVLGPNPVADPAAVASLARLRGEAAMSPRDFVSRFTGPDAPRPVTLSYDPARTAYYDRIGAALALTAPERAAIARQGFMVSDRLSYGSFHVALHDTYTKDLPLLVTSDMVLHALHASFDAMLRTVEREGLVPLLQDTLDRAHAELGRVGSNEASAEAVADADLLLAVARSLLRGEPVGAVGRGGETRRLYDLALAAGGLRDVELFGCERTFDWSQLRPRGHYEGDPVLERYFRAMTWLGRTDLRFLELQGEGDAWVFQPRQLEVGLLLVRCLEGSGAYEGWARTDRALRALIGEPDDLDPAGLRRLAADHGLGAPRAARALDAAAQAALGNALLSGRYGMQRIASQVLRVSPFLEQPLALPPSFLLFGQRFAIDSAVLGNLVFDRVLHRGEKVDRVLPDPLDVLFVLGNDRVLPHLSFERYPYHENLYVLRRLAEGHDAAFWEASVYNQWLSALRALNAPTTSAAFPEPMRTQAWADRIASTQLASWAQLRHDTVLYVKQSYTLGVSCEYPDAYVDPYPELYAGLARLARTWQAAADATPLPDERRTRLHAFLGRFGELMGRLSGIAAREVAGEPLAPDDLAFLQGTLTQQTGGVCGMPPTFDGWYSDLFLVPEDASELEPTIADVHTNPNQGDPLPGPNVLHVGTGWVHLLVLTTEDGRSFVGPVFSYFEVDVPEVRRLTDAEWRELLSDAGCAPARPRWSQSFVVR